MEHENDGDANCNRCTWNTPQKTDKELEDLEIRGQVEAIQTTALLKSARILRIVLETWGDMLSLQWETIS